MKKMLILLFLLIISPAFAISINTPDVTFDRVIGPSDPPNPSEYIASMNYDLNFKLAPTASGSFFKVLGKSKDSLLNTLNYTDVLEVKTEEFKIDKYEIVKVHMVISSEYKQYGEKAPAGVGYYIFENNINIGYFLIDDFEITEVMNDPIVKKIKSLPSNNSYLNKEINFYTGTRMEFHERRKGKYVEKYGLLYTEGNRIFLYLDSFYPKEFEVELRKYLIQELKKNMKDKIRN